MGAKVSVIMPSLNVADYIEEAVQSVINQTLKDIEIICIDAGSNDGTWEILTRLAAADGRIILRHSDRKSYGYQVNLGIAMASGEYIAVVETDDYVDSKMYEGLYQEAIVHDCDYVKSDYFAYWTQADRKRVFVRKNIFFNQELYGIVMEPKLHWETATGDWYLWSGIYKKEFLIRENIRLSETPGAAFQDIGFLCQTNIKAKRVLYLKEHYYRYCMDRDGASSNSGKGLQYSYQEFSCLCNSIRDTMDRESAQVFYCRMAKSFMCCYGEIESRGLRIEDNEKKDYYQWFQTQLKTAKEQGIINAQVIRPEIWDKVEKLLISEEYYIEKVQEREKYMQGIIGQAGEYPVIIFGCGYYGYQAYGWLKRHGYSIMAFMDNNQELWGTKIDEYFIESPQQIPNMPVHIKYLIANEQHSGEIKQQLLELGVEKENICIYV